MSTNTDISTPSGSNADTQGKPSKRRKPAKETRTNRIIIVPKDDEPDPSDPLGKYTEKLIPKVVDKLVREAKRPITRRELIEYLFASDPRLQEYEKTSMHNDALISYAISKLLKRGRLIRIEYCKEHANGKCLKVSMRKEYILPEHLQLPEIQEYLRKKGTILG
jgi:hypothetical protein